MNIAGHMWQMPCQSVIEQADAAEEASAYERQLQAVQDADLRLVEVDRAFHDSYKLPYERLMALHAQWRDAKRHADDMRSRLGGTYLRLLLKCRRV